MSLHDNPTYNNETMHLYMRSRGLEVENPSPVSDVARLGRVARFPDGSMVFSYGGVDLIRLWPVQVATKVENGSTVLTATRQYEMLI